MESGRSASQTITMTGAPVFARSARAASGYRRRRGRARGGGGAQEDGIGLPWLELSEAKVERGHSLRLGYGAVTFSVRPRAGGAAARASGTYRRPKRAPA